MGAFMSIFLSVFLSYIVIIMLCLFRPVRRNPSGHHGPPSYPIIRSLIPFYKNRNRLLDWYTELLAHSPTQTIIIRRLGARTTIVTANPENVERILKTNFNNFPKGKPFTEILGDFLGHGIFNVDGELWRVQRKLISHEFSKWSLREVLMKTLAEEVEKHLLPVLSALVEANCAVDLQDLLGRFSFNVICKVTLGFNACCLDPSVPISPLAISFDTASNISARRGAAPLFMVWKMKRWLRIGSERKLKEAIEQVHRHIIEIISERKKMGVSVTRGREDLLSRMVSAGHEEEAIRDTVISFILAGRDTTSAAMTWLFWLLSRDQATEEKLVKEAERVRLLDYESLKGLNLLKACICESMRLYPPVAWDSKHAIVDDLLPDGTQVKAGDRVTYFPYGMGRMEVLWGKDRFKFRPNRWLVDPDMEGESSLIRVCPFKFPIFQAGPRMCLGKEMAFIQMKYVVVSVLRRFKVRPLRSDEPVFVPLLTAHMAGGLKVMICPRERFVM